MALGKNLISTTNAEKGTELLTAPVQEDGSSKSEKAVAAAEVSAEADHVHESLLQYCVFALGKEAYAIPISLVKEVVPASTSSPLPQVPSYIVGMTNVRGNIYGILDLKKYLSSSKEEGKNEFLLVLDHEEYQVGITIQQVPDTITIAPSEIENLPASKLKSVKGRKYLKGIIKKEKRMIILFDMLGLIAEGVFNKTTNDQYNT